MENLNMDTADAVTMFANLGAVGLIAFFALRFMLVRMRETDEQAKARESRILEQVSTLEKFINTEMIGLVRGTTAALAENSAALKQTTIALQKTEQQAEATHMAMKELVADLKNRPCPYTQENTS